MQLNYPKERIFDREVPGSKQKGNTWVAPLVRIMTAAEAYEIIGTMANGAKRARELGYDGIEVQASYGDFISQLLSPLSNKRTDEFGGSPENRGRFLIGLIKEVKEKAGKDYPVMVKLVCDEFVEGGLGLNDTTAIARLAEQAGADAIPCVGREQGDQGHDDPLSLSSTRRFDSPCQRNKKGGRHTCHRGREDQHPGAGGKGGPRRRRRFCGHGPSAPRRSPFPMKAQEGRTEEIRRCLYDLEDCADKGVKGIGRTLAP